MLAEFARSDFSTVLDEGAAVKYGARLRDKLGAPSLSTTHRACAAPVDSASLEAARVWHHLTPITNEKGLFIHIPKTAGTSFNSILREASSMRKRRSASFHLRSWTTGRRGFDARGAAIW